MSPRILAWPSSAARAALFAALLAVCSASALAGSPCTLDRATGTTVASIPFISSGYGAQWNGATNRIAFMRPDTQGYYRLFLIRPDGSGTTPLTEGRGDLPPGHHGTPYWFPSGRYLLFTAQKRDWRGGRAFGIPAYGALPGWGVHDDLWVMEVASGRAWRLTDAPNSRNQGVLIPIAAPNGRLVAWSARQPDRNYKITVADFLATPSPHLGNIRSYEPGGPAYYETGSFSSDSRSLFYTSDQDTQSFWQSQIYRLDLATGRSTRLTHGHTYNEHPAAVPTPSGDWVVFMSTRGERRRPLQLRLGTDWWAMRPDGSGLKRLTTMNLGRPHNREDAGRTLVAGKVTVNPGGDVLLGDVQDSLVHQTGFVQRIQLVCPAGG
ncbi:MAG: TolB family protein [Steroidobacteraceae bacterium]